MNLNPKTAEEMLIYFKSVSHGKQLQFIAESFEDILVRLSEIEKQITEPKPEPAKRETSWKKNSF